MENDLNNLALSQAIIVMPHKLDLKVISEDVENIEQQKILVDAGCDFAQGYLFSKPIAAIDFDTLLQQYN